MNSFWDRFFHSLPKSTETSEIQKSKSDLSISIRKIILGHRIAEIIDSLFVRTRFFSHRNPVLKYIRRFVSISAEAAILIAIVWVLCVSLLYMTYMMWQLYIETPMYQKFQELFPKRAEAIFELTELNYWYFATELTLSSFVICTVIGAVGNFSHINRHLYWSRGFFGKLIYWGSALTCSVAYYLHEEYGFSSWGVTVLIAAIPTFCMFIYCFEYCDVLIPECGDIIKGIVHYVQRLKKEIFSD